VGKQAIAAAGYAGEESPDFAKRDASEMLGAKKATESATENIPLQNFGDRLKKRTLRVLLFAEMQRAL